MKNNYFNCFLFTNNRGCDLIKKKTGIIKPEGEIVKERLFITPEYTTAKEIKKIRKQRFLSISGFLSNIFYFTRRISPAYSIFFFLK